MSGFTCFENGNRDDPSTSWPGSFGYDPNSDLFRYSVQSSWKINVFSHLFIVNYDVGLAPRSMEISLPILDNLPSRSRLYFVYVENSDIGDTLNFSVVPGSGNVVNQDPVSKSFDLSSSPVLFIVGGFHNNWIIFPFAKTASSSSIQSDLPLQKWDYTLTPITNTAWYDFYPWAFYSFFQYDTSLLTGNNIFPGGLMTYVLLPDTYLISEGTLYAFTPSQSGYYSININGQMTFQYNMVDDTVTVVQGKILECYDGNAARSVAQFPVDCFIWEGGGDRQTAAVSTEVKLYMQTGMYYVVAILWYHTSESSTPTIYSDNQNLTQQGIYFQQLKTTNDPGAPVSLSLLAKAASSSTPRVFSSVVATDKKSIQDLQLKNKALLPTPSLATGGGVVGEGVIAGVVPPISFSLADVELIVEKALNQAIQKKGGDGVTAKPVVVSPSAAAVSSASLSLSSSSSSSSKIRSSKSILKNATVPQISQPLPSESTSPSSTPLKMGVKRKRVDKKEEKEDELMDAPIKK